MAKRKHQRVPQILHRFLNGLARSLEQTILSLVPDPPSPDQCPCRGRPCLACIGRAHLIDEDADPPDYKGLLSNVFCFVPADAPPPPRLFTSCCHSQRKVVRNTIQKLMNDSRTRTNMICVGYDEGTFDLIDEALCTHAWDILLERIGDHLMVFLLKFSSIFLPLTNKCYQQVTGPPLTEILQGSTIKRVNYEKKLDQSIDSSGCSEVTIARNVPSSHSEELYMQSHNRYGDVQSSSTNGSRKTKSRKRRRQYSWQRRLHHKKLLKTIDLGANDKSNKVLDAGDKNSDGISEFSLLQDVEEIINWKTYSCYAEDKTHGNEISPLAENDRHCPLVILDDEPERKPHMGNLQSQSHLEKLQMMPHRFHGFMLQTTQKSATEATENHISRSIFYNSRSPYSLFPKKHILNQVDSDNTGSVLLLNHIFGLSSTDFQCSCHKGVSGSSPNCLYHYLLGLLKSLIRNAQNCPQKKLLRKHCLIPVLTQCGDEGKESTCEVEGASGFYAPKLDIAECYSKYHHVVQFIWAVIRNIIPKDFLGNASNMRKLLSNISKFVALRRFEKYTLSQCAHKLEISQYNFLSNSKFSRSFRYKVKKEIRKFKYDKEGIHKSSDIRRTLQNQVFQRWIHWVFSGIIVPMISACFYVTERQLERNCLFYYPKPLWKKLFDATMNPLNGKNYMLLDRALVNNIILKRGFGYSKVRLIPKKRDVRIVANTRLPSKLQVNRNNGTKTILFRKSINSSLKELHAVLKRIAQEHPHVLGSSVFGYSDIHKKLSEFLPGLKGRPLKTPGVYIVVTDVSKAFDTMKQDKLLEIMKPIIQNVKYFLRNITRVISMKNGIRTFSNHLLCGDHSSNSNTMRSEAETRLCSSPSIIIDQGRSKYVKSEKLYHLLSEHLKYNILKNGEKFYLQNVGICQGSSISSLLCSFYLGHLERSKILPYLEKDGLSSAHNLNEELLLSKETLKNNGLISEPSYNDYHGKASTRGDTDCIRNLAVDAYQDNVSLETEHWHQRDHTRGCTNDVRHDNLYSPNNLLLRFIDDFLFISTSKEQAKMFFNRMYKGFEEYNCNMNNTKCGLNFDLGKSKPILNRLYTGADGIQFLPWSGLLINCQTLEIQADYTRYLNIRVSSTITVQADDSIGSSLKDKLCFYMRPKCHPIFYDSKINSSATVRLNAYQAFLLCAMKFHCYICSISDNTELNPSYLAESIERSFRYMHKLVKKQIHVMEVYNIHPILKLKKAEMIWLGLSAYIWILKRKQARHKELLSLLRCKISNCEKLSDDLASLKYATEASHSSLFKDINF